MSEKKQTKQPKFLCRRTGRECCLCLIGHIERVWECKNLVVRPEKEGEQ